MDERTKWIKITPQEKLCPHDDFSPSPTVYVKTEEDAHETIASFGFVNPIIQADLK